MKTYDLTLRYCQIVCGSWTVYSTRSSSSQSGKLTALALKHNSIGLQFKTQLELQNLKMLSPLYLFLKLLKMCRKHFAILRKLQI